MYNSGFVAIDRALAPPWLVLNGLRSGRAQVIVAGFKKFFGMNGDARAILISTAGG